MKTKRWVDGLNNSQKIRVIVDGVGFYTTVQGAFDLCFHHQRVAVTSALSWIGMNQQNPVDRRMTGYGTRMNVLNHEGKEVEVEVQIDLV